MLRLLKTIACCAKCCFRILLQDHFNVHLHFTPTYSSWLNQVEIRFGRIEREVIAPDVFTSVRDLARKRIVVVDC